MPSCLKPFIVLLAVLGICLRVSPAFADCDTVCDDPAGVVSLPANADLGVPFKKGEQALITSLYGPNGGSSGHCRSQDSWCANDYFALDLILPAYPNNGFDQPVLAAQSGTVIDAALGSDGWASYGQRVYIEHDFGDGHKYTTVYAHLNTMKVSKGQKVNKGDTIGTMGHSSMGEVEYAGMGVHLHFSIHRDPGFGGTGSGGSYGGRAVRPEPLDGQSGFTKLQTITSNNDGSTTPPPPACDIVIQATAETVIEDDSTCAQKKGSPNESSAGLGGHAFQAVLDNPDPDYAEGLFWNLVFAQAGEYDLYAWIPAGIPELTTEAVYKIQHAADASFATLDQSASPGAWLLVGTYTFAAGGDQWVRLGDNYKSAASQGKTFVMDALKVAPAAGGTGGQGGAAAGDAGAADAAAGAAGHAGATSGAGGSAGTQSSSPAPGAGSDDSGCACALGPRAAGRVAGCFAVLGLALIVFRCRRRRR